MIVRLHGCFIEWVRQVLHRTDRDAPTKGEQAKSVLPLSEPVLAPTAGHLHCIKGASFCSSHGQTVQDYPVSGIEERRINISPRPQIVLTVWNQLGGTKPDTAIVHQTHRFIPQLFMVSCRGKPLFVLAVFSLKGKPPLACESEGGTSHCVWCLPICAERRSR